MVERVAADGVVDDIGAFAAGHRAHSVANTFIPVVDQFVSPARTGHSQLFRAAGRGDDPSADRLADLDRRQPDPAGSAEHKQRLARMQMTALGVRRDKAALSSGCKPHPAIRSSRKQPEQAWRRRNV